MIHEDWYAIKQIKKQLNQNLNNLNVMLSPNVDTITEHSVQNEPIANWLEFASRLIISSSLAFHVFSYFVFFFPPTSSS